MKYQVSFGAKHMIPSLVKKKNERCCGYIINRAFPSESKTVRYFTGAFLMERTLHDRLEIRISLLQLVLKIFQNEYEKRNFLSPSGHLISSIYTYEHFPHKLLLGQMNLNEDLTWVFLSSPVSKF